MSSDRDPRNTKTRQRNSEMRVRQHPYLLEWVPCRFLILVVGNMYRTVRELNKSGAAFERAADIQQRYLKDNFEAAKMLQDAFKSYRDVSPADSVRCLDQSIQLYSAKGNFRRAADLMVDMADIYETKLQDPAKGLKSLETAIMWYSDEGIQA